MEHLIGASTITITTTRRSGLRVGDMITLYTIRDPKMFKITKQFQNMVCIFDEIYEKKAAIPLSKAELNKQRRQEREKLSNRKNSRWC